jgi:ribonuclease VapC
VSKVVFLDTSAWLTWSQDEPGADEIEAYFEAAMDGDATLHASFVSLTELEYITTQQFGTDKARELLESVEDKPVRWHQSDRALCREAAKLKAAHKVSFADAFVAATAQRLDATLVHKDPEFDALKDVIKLHGLPPKAGQTT